MSHSSNATLELGASPLIATFTALARPGSRMPWAFASRTSLATFANTVSAVRDATSGAFTGTQLSIELFRVLDENVVATVGRSLPIGEPIAMPDDPLAIETAPLAEIGALKPRSFSAHELFISVPALPSFADSIILLAVVELPTQGFVPIGMRYLADDDGDGIAEDDLRELATQHTLFVTAPTGPLAGWPISLVVIAQNRAVLDSGTISQTRLIVPIARGTVGVVQLPRADFLAAPRVTIEDGALTIDHDGTRAIAQLVDTGGAHDIELRDGVTTVSLASLALADDAQVTRARTELLEDGRVVASAE